MKSSVGTLDQILENCVVEVDVKISSRGDNIGVSK